MINTTATEPLPTTGDAWSELQHQIDCAYDCYEDVTDLKAQLKALGPRPRTESDIQSNKDFLKEIYESMFAPEAQARKDA